VSWHFGGPVPADQDYREQDVVERLLAQEHGGVLVLGISRMGKSSLLYRLGERFGKKARECVIQVSSPERALPRINQGDGLILLDEAQQLREWKSQELRQLRSLLEDRPFVMAAHPSLFRGNMDAELKALVDDLRRERLPPLGDEAARGMIRRARSATPERCEPAVEDAIYRATGGFPNLIAGLCLYLSEEGRAPLRAPGEADLRTFVRSDIGGEVFRNIYDSLPPQMQEALDDHRSGRPADLGLLREPFLVSGASADFCAALFPQVWGAEGSWVSRKPSASSRPIDFCIITALEEERDAVLKLLPDHRQLERDGLGHTYYEATVKTQWAGREPYRVIVTCLSSMGPLKAANKANAVSNRWKPRNVLVVGIGGGLTGEVALGDVMVASSIADYTLGKDADGRSRQVRWGEYHADADLFDAAKNFTKGWKELIACVRPEEGDPVRYSGIVASGGDVIASKRTIARFRKQFPKLIGVEMEGGGVAAALHEDPQKPRLLMIRGVSDLADGEQNAEIKARWRGYACHVAAAYAIGLLRSGPVPCAA
jgi:nucleoside phosphorylase